MKGKKMRSRERVGRKGKGAGRVGGAGEEGSGAA